MSVDGSPQLATLASAPADRPATVSRGIGLTERQRETLRYIDAYQQASDGISPSFVEIRDRLRLNAKSGVHRLLSGLEERGHIRRSRTHFTRHRALEVVDPQPFPRPSLNGEPLLLVPVHGGNNG
ncbi:LexA family protein [Sphingopyxis macrogoltabida]|uniref:LexA repressor DNA-binding domain-containing protein n=1 Tax=Sphingopyxis macrogoltabida TaxID=33050 RepID=A0AAC8Z1F8_SPHMC|nr:hypothetical protein [Sphingopyxis macrogoltabida]ALJ12610.1 phosphatidylglycerol:prolipoprotein diacylglycerol transferase [Sphingopyxis macrogoltabida]AMU89919.1 hypothetical protein ATM17_12820 [Sphingopyxis macrogoltabida]